MWEETFKSHHDSKPFGRREMFFIEFENIHVLFQFSKVRRRLVSMWIFSIMNMFTEFPNTPMLLLCVRLSKEENVDQIEILWSFSYS